MKKEWVIMSKAFLIANPIAGRGKAKKRFPSAALTTKAGDAEKWACEAALSGKYDEVWAIGGDGTVNEVARGLVKAGNRDVALGIIGIGSGNGFANHLKHNKVEGLVDVGWLKLENDRREMFCCTCGVGFDAKVAADYAKAGTRGLRTYIKSALTDWFNYAPTQYEIEVENENGEKEHTSVKALLVVCGNANQWGNECHVTPQAIVNDGLLDLTIVEPVRLTALPKMLAQIFGYRFNKNSHVKTIRGRKISITTERGVNVQYDGEIVCGVDGEPIETRYIEMQVQKDALRVVRKKTR